jgi:hypothetical protein
MGKTTLLFVAYCRVAEYIKDDALLTINASSGKMWVTETGNAEFGQEDVIVQVDIEPAGVAENLVNSMGTIYDFFDTNKQDLGFPELAKELVAVVRERMLTGKILKDPVKETTLEIIMEHNSYRSSIPGEPIEYDSDEKYVGILGYSCDVVKHSLMAGKSG